MTVALSDISSQAENKTLWEIVMTLHTVRGIPWLWPPVRGLHAGQFYNLQDVLLSTAHEVALSSGSGDGTAGRKRLVANVMSLEGKP